MPRFSAARGEPMAAIVPSTRISPSSARCAPARIFMSVDLPAPFSPTSTSTSPRYNVSETPESARTPGNDFPMLRISSRGPSTALAALAPLRMTELLLGVLFRERADVDLDERGRRFAGEIVVNDVDRSRADLVGELDRVADHSTGGNRGARFRRRVVSHDCNLSG